MKNLNTFLLYPVLKTLHHKLYWIARTLDCLDGKLVIRRGKMYSIYLWKRSLKEIQFHIQFNENRGCLKFSCQNFEVGIVPTLLIKCLRLLSTLEAYYPFSFDLRSWDNMPEGGGNKNNLILPKGFS